MSDTPTPDTPTPDTPTPDTPIHHDDQIDRLLRDAGARMRAATEVDHLSSSRPIDRRGTPRRWIVPVAIVTATAAAVVAAVWLAGPATDTVREAPADTGLVSTPDSAVDSLPAVEPVESSVPTEMAPVATTPAAPAPDTGEATVSVTAADFDGAGGTCLRLLWNGNDADGCFTHRDLEDTPSWTVVLDGRAFDVAVDAFDPDSHTITMIDGPEIDFCGHGSSALVPDRWSHVSCSADHFWFRAVAENPDGTPSVFVVPPSTREPIALEPLASTLPDGLAAYRATAEIDGTQMACLVIGTFPDLWREACGETNQLFRLLVPAAGSAFLVESEPGFRGVEVTDIAVLSVPIVGCTAPVTDMAAAIMNSSVAIVGLVCAGEWAMVGVPSGPSPGRARHGGGFVLYREPDGSWLTHAAGSSFPCEADLLPACEAFGIDGDLLTAPLPIPPWGLIGRPRARPRPGRGHGRTSAMSPVAHEMHTRSRRP